MRPYFEAIAMSDKPQICPKCGCEMAQEFVPGPAYGFNRTEFGPLALGQWMKGPPKRSFWSGVKGLWNGERIPIATFRCIECGFLESYARPEFAPK